MDSKMEGKVTASNVTELTADASTIEFVPSSLMTLCDRFGNQILEIKYDGKIYVHKKLVDDDKQLVEALRDFLRKEGYPV